MTMTDVCGSILQVLFMHCRSELKQGETTVSNSLQAAKPTAGANQLEVNLHYRISPDTVEIG